MVVAVIVSILALALAIGVIMAFFKLSSGRRGTGKAATGHDDVQAVNNVGFASGGDEAKPGVAAQQPSARPATTTGRPSEALRSRFVAIGVLAAAVFGSLTTKLWSMQVLSSDEYRSEALRNKYATVATPAPRGQIYDADGVLLVKNRTTLTVLADASAISDHDVIYRLSAVLGIPYNVVRARIQDQSSGAQSQRVVASDAPQRAAAFISEHSDAFPGINVEERSVREYPYGALAAHVLGYTGPVSEDELDTMGTNRTIELGDVVGKSGMESYYDNILAGEHGQRRVVVDSGGSVVEVESETAATRGSDIYLTIKAPIQYVADQGLADLVAPDGIIGHGRGVGGAVVALDLEDGSVLAMASYPTYSPAMFTGGIAQDIWDLYSTPESYYPLLNRAISGTYPAASTYKAFTSLAGLKYGFADNRRQWNCTGSWDGFESGDIQHCWNHEGHGDISLHNGIVVSCDVVFYEIAKDFFFAGRTQGGSISDTALQEEIAKFGFGVPTGIDLSGEESGRIPTPEWKAQHWSDVPTEGQWRGGDLTNLVIGQGDVLITPLQNAIAYGGVATGRLMRPHLLKEVRNTTDRAAVSFEPEVVSEPEIDQENFDLVRKALSEVSLTEDKIAAQLTSYKVDVKTIASKTGTGEVAGKGDVAWYVCYYPNDNPRFLVATCIEEGGGGAVAAGPLGASVLGACVAFDRGDLKEIRPIAASTGKSDVTKGTGEEARTD